MLVMSFTGCAPVALYSWHNYEDKSYEWVKAQTPESEAKLMKTYERIINQQGGQRRTPPPGICAEYGYLLLKKGEKERGLALLKREIALYPESEHFVGKIIKQFE